MRRYLVYLDYVLRHKAFVLLAGLRVGAPLWRLLTHDWTKFLPCEFGPYARYFYEADGTKSLRRGVDEEFALAWLHHQRNRHHWQAWISIGDDGGFEALPMPDDYAREMVADWMGAGRAITGTWEAREWYLKNKEDMILHTTTRRKVEQLLGLNGTEE